MADISGQSSIELQQEGGNLQGSALVNYDDWANGPEWDDYDNMEEPMISYHTGTEFSNPDQRTEFYHAQVQLEIIRQCLSPAERTQIEQKFSDRAWVMRNLKRIFSNINTKVSKEIMENGLNPYLINLTNYVPGKNRWQDFLAEAYQIQKEEFNFPNFPEPGTKKFHERNLYNGINKCHKSHVGLSVAKLMHAVVTYKDIMYGSDQWKWGDMPAQTTPPSQDKSNHTTPSQHHSTQESAIYEEARRQIFKEAAPLERSKTLVRHQEASFIAETDQALNLTKHSAVYPEDNFKINRAGQEQRPFSGSVVGNPVSGTFVGNSKMHLSDYQTQNQTLAVDQNQTLIVDYSQQQSLGQPLSTPYGQPVLNVANPNMASPGTAYQILDPQDQADETYQEDSALDLLFCSKKLKSVKLLGKEEKGPPCWVMLSSGVCCIVLLLTIILIASVPCYKTVKEEMNKKTGCINENMCRLAVEPRSGYQSRVEEQGLMYHDEPSISWSSCEEDAYWNEEGALKISHKAEVELLEATQQLHYMCLEAVDKVIKDPKLLRLFHIPSDLWPAMRKSWGLAYDEGQYVRVNDIQMDLLGRFDFAWDGKSPPKMLEYNADTPSLLLESSEIQGSWYTDKFIGNKNSDLPYTQSNYITQALKQALISVVARCTAEKQKDKINNIQGRQSQLAKIGLLTVDFDDEGAAQMQLIQKILDEFYPDSIIENISNLKLTYSINDTTSDGCKPVFKMLDQEVSCLINSYPKEWLVNELERDELLKYDLSDVRLFEPWWKLILGNKAILPLLWSMFPNHPNLLPTFYDSPYESLDNSLGEQQSQTLVNQLKWVSKPLFGREGLGVLRSTNYSSTQQFIYDTDLHYGRDGSTGQYLGKSIYQQYHRLPEMQGRVVQTSAWVIGGQAAGLNFREGKAGTDFIDSNPFLPHIVIPKRGGQIVNLNIKMNTKQNELRKKMEQSFSMDSIYNSNPFIQGVSRTVSDNFYDIDTKYTDLKAQDHRNWKSYKYSNQSSNVDPERDYLGDMDALPSMKTKLRNLKCISTMAGSMPKYEETGFRRQLSHTTYSRPISRTEREFNNIDKNQDGAVDNSEMIAYLKSKKVHRPSYTDALEIIAFYDTNRNEKIETQEYTKIMESPDFGALTIGNIVETFYLPPPPGTSDGPLNYKPKLEDVRIQAYFHLNKKFQTSMRKSNFGSLTFNSIDYAGEDQGQWYSVDNQGRIRTHMIATAGVYQTARNNQRTAYSRRTRSSKGRSSSS